MNKIVKDFHTLYYGEGNNRIYGNTFYMGLRCEKCPLDLWTYQEILFDTKPDVVVETGSLAGASALYLAHIMDIIGKGKIISIDINEEKNRPTHPRITWYTGDSVSNKTLYDVKNFVNNESCMVILDSDHSYSHVLQEMIKYQELVSIGNYLIVEDSNVNGNPVRPDWGPGPMEAIKEFILFNKNFEIDDNREKFLMTFNPSGFLRKIK